MRKGCKRSSTTDDYKTPPPEGILGSCTATTHAWRSFKTRHCHHLIKDERTRTDLSLKAFIMHSYLPVAPASASARLETASDTSSGQ